MPSQTNPDGGGASDIKIKAAYNGEFMISYIPDSISYEELCQEIRVICRFPPEQVSFSYGFSSGFICICESSPVKPTFRKQWLGLFTSW